MIIKEIERDREKYNILPRSIYCCYPYRTRENSHTQRKRTHAALSPVRKEKRERKENAITLNRSNFSFYNHGLKIYL